MLRAEHRDDCDVNQAVSKVSKHNPDVPFV